MKVLPNITSLRFFLAFLVMIFHIPQFFSKREISSFNDWPIFHKGTEAVFMFFSLSGFLIFRQLYDEKIKNDRIDLKKFYLRRILRIFPVYYLVVFIGLFYYNLFLPAIGIPVERSYDLVKGILLLITFFPNLLLLDSPGGILEILWSIGIEEQCYLLTAPLFALIPQKYYKAFFIILSFILVYLYEFSDLVFLKDYKMIFFYFTFAGWCSLQNFKNYRFQKLTDAVVYILIILFFTTDIFVDYFSEPLYFIFSMLLFGYFITVFVRKPIPFFENKTLIYLGKISYGIYMYHVVVMQLIGFIFLKILLRFRINDTVIILSSYLSVIAITVITAHISYQYYEKIFLNKKKLYRVTE
ncbi:acyltransferase [Chryseobacterium sp. SN22]|uniref:acyltransferase family protein n=1 Tax=Chryseobacterium sp. SN22 TaxID=2606431 RepID=UPI0011EE41FD|nr:acyltransferase [Chryseobacterium sp. SN22]KAA0127753.1 acyltransferase [Chryseobacterium sp. SN22]